MQRKGYAGVKSMLEYSLNRREAGAARHQDNRAFGRRSRHPCARDAQGCASVAGGRTPEATGISTSLYVSRSRHPASRGISTSLYVIFAQKECPQRPLETQQRLFLHLGKNMIGEMAARDMADVNL